MQTIHLEPKQVPDHLKAGYNGCHLKARVVESVHIPINQCEACLENAVYGASEILIQII